MIDQALSAADGNAIGMVLYFDRILTASGRHILAGVGKIQPAWVVAAASFDPQLASSYQQTIRATEREQFHIILSSFPRMVSSGVNPCATVCGHNRLSSPCQHPLRHEHEMLHLCVICEAMCMQVLSAGCCCAHSMPCLVHLAPDFHGPYI